ncbi:hypothetical protein FACS1894166_08090 [Bacilli bacterium]|nr:hypothetical protein FACS1894166_08090 [Bacilli bacterium]
MHISEEGSDNATDIRNERIEASNKRRDSEIQETYKNIDDDS